MSVISQTTQLATGKTEIEEKSRQKSVKGLKFTGVYLNSRKNYLGENPAKIDKGVSQ
jgi:hypothetical protein